MRDVQEHNASRGVNFEDVWLMFQETDRKFKETDRKFQETDRKFQEMAQEMAERSKATDRQLRKSKKELDRKMGELGNRFGELAEHLVAPNIQAKFNALGCQIDAFAPGLTIRDHDDQALAELDLFLQSADCVIAVEVKAKPQEKDVDAHIRRLEILRRWADKTHDVFVGHRKIRGAVAGAIVSDEVRQYVLKAGFYMILQTGDTVKIAIPEGFVPREW
jgi:hypothetical protein